MTLSRPTPLLTERSPFRYARFLRLVSELAFLCHTAHDNGGSEAGDHAVGDLRRDERREEPALQEDAANHQELVQKVTQLQSEHVDQSSNHHDSNILPQISAFAQ